MILCLLQQLVHSREILFEVSTQTRGGSFNLGTQFPGVLAPFCSEILQKLNMAVLFSTLFDREGMGRQDVHVPDFSGPPSYFS